MTKITIQKQTIKNHIKTIKCINQPIKIEIYREELIEIYREEFGDELAIMIKEYANGNGVSSYEEKLCGRTVLLDLTDAIIKERE